MQGTSEEVKKSRHHKFGQPFQQVYSLLVSSRVWAKGAKIRPVKARKKGKQAEVDQGTFCSLLGLPLDPSFFRVLDEGDARAEKFYEAAGTTGGWGAGGRKMPSIATVTALLKTKHSDEMAEWTLLYSTDHDDLCESKMTAPAARAVL